MLDFQHIREDIITVQWAILEAISICGQPHKQAAAQPQGVIFAILTQTCDAQRMTNIMLFQCVV